MAAMTSFLPPPADNPEPLLKSPADIAQALRRGGYVIYLRHGRTRYDQLELERNNRRAGLLDLSRCDTQRQLSDAGRAEMQVAGAQFRTARLPIGKAFSSRYCRAIESARFFVDDAVAVEDLSGEGEVGLNPANRPRTLAFLSRQPPAGSNHFMMAHGGVFWEATGFVIQEAHCVVLDPVNLKVVVARIGPYEWSALAGGLG